LDKKHREPSGWPGKSPGYGAEVIGWVVLGIVVGSLLVLALAVRATASRLPGLKQAQADLQKRAGEAQALQVRLADVQARQADMQKQLALIQHRIGIIKGRLAKKRQSAG
jgi:uncharacterized membrane-anchored protein YhcB (DUF1043 family)